MDSLNPDLVIEAPVPQCSSKTAKSPRPHTALPIHVKTGCDVVGHYKDGLARDDQEERTKATGHSKHLQAVDVD